MARLFPLSAREVLRTYFFGIVDNMCVVKKNTIVANMCVAKKKPTTTCSTNF